ncbi:class I SAM-dependent methyltransferase [Flavobacterium sp. K77]|uniref:THUMP-like domain-containing protein n=1 Tax=Flavobacterium sp. K77 TaxID=2910676 RepID=UPI001F1DB347|nr:class I SAM-dependent methyltransferase [Flavobacterium sp. K77]
MKTALLNPEIQDYINTNIGQNISTLALQKNPFPDVNWMDILNQIEAKTKAKEKLPSWFAQKNIIYPSKISVEQTSSEKTAHYKASLIKGESLIDLTGGFGVDDFYFSKTINQIAHCEMNADLSTIVQHNYTQLNVSNIKTYVGDSILTLQQLNQKWDWIYIDPSRRSDVKGKVFLLKDCLPNVPENLNNYFSYSKNILIKTAPLLDLTAGLAELNFVKTIYIIAVENEVKELLWEIEQNYIKEPRIKTVNLRQNQIDTFEYAWNQETSSLSLSEPLRYLYEPNSAIMKSGGFDAVAQQYQLQKLHKHSHLYTSDEILSFPGRVFEIQNNFEYSKPNMKKYLENQKINITTRNFPETVANIRKKWKIKEGGLGYCFFSTDLNNRKIVLICTKIEHS